MKIKLGELKRLIKEAAMQEASGVKNYTFEVYGPDDETYVCTATYNPRTPFEIEVWKATTQDGTEVDVDELRAMGLDLDAAAFDQVSKESGDGLGRDPGDFDVHVNDDPFDSRIDLSGDY